MNALVNEAHVPAPEFVVNNDSFVSFHGGVDGLKHKVVDGHTERKMDGNNINRRRDPLLFFPYVALPRHLRNGLPPKQALQGIFRELADCGLYKDGRWMYQETFADCKPEGMVAQFFQTIQDAAFLWAGAELVNMTCNWRDHSTHLVQTLRKPDVILCPKGCTDITFKDVLTYCELKESFSSDARKEAEKQLTEIAGYASANQLHRRFYTASSLCNRKLTLATFIRGSTVVSEPLDIDSNPIDFLSCVLGFSAASAAWCGFAPHMITAPRNTFDIKFLDFAKVTMGSVLLYAAIDMHGRGTKVPLCNVWKTLAVPPKAYPIKMSWMASVPPDGKGRLSNDIDIATLFANRARQFPSLNGPEKRIFGKDDEFKIFSGYEVSPADEHTWDYVKHWPGITIVLPEDCDRPRAPCPSPNEELWETGYYPDDYAPPMEPDTTRNILQRFNVPVRIGGKLVNEKWEPQDEDANYIPPRLYGETRELIWVLYRSCGTSIVWFSCRRELVNGFMGALSGHFNALMLKILHCDISDLNLLFLVKDSKPESVVPDLPSEEGAYPKRPGMLGDWGYAADLAEASEVRRITGTLPYMATDFLSDSPAKAHTVRHDLESLFWVLWVVCVNMNGPFYTRRIWQDEFRSRKTPGPSSPCVSGRSCVSSSISPTNAGGSSSLLPDPSSRSLLSPLQRQDTFLEQPWREGGQRVPVTTRLPFREAEPAKHAPPIWATPGRHELGPLDVFRAKDNMAESVFLDCISPYFRQSGPGFLEGMKTLHTYFVKMRGPEGEKLKERMGEITHTKFCEILKAMRDSIPANIDQLTTKEIKDARHRYQQLYNAGGNHGIAIAVLDSQHKSCRSKRVVEEQSGQASKGKRSKK